MHKQYTVPIQALVIVQWTLIKVKCSGPAKKLIVTGVLLKKKFIDYAHNYTHRDIYIVHSERISS